MLVYYGILDPSDAQCFRVEASINSAAYLLAVSAILLAFLNTYVSNASRQYFRDIENKSKQGTAASEEPAPMINFDDNISAVTGPGHSVQYQAGTNGISPYLAENDELQPLTLQSRGSDFSNENDSISALQVWAALGTAAVSAAGIMFFNETCETHLAPPDLPTPTPRLLCMIYCFQRCYKVCCLCF